jgi:hypothetical protein
MIEVVVIHPKSLDETFCKWCDAVTINGRIYIPSSLMEDDKNLPILHHEIIHGYVYSLTGNRIAAWIEEGLAQIISGQARETPEAPPRGFSLKSLEKHFKGSNPDLALAAYDVSVHAVRYLLHNYGFTSFGEYMKKISLGYSHQRAFVSVFKITESELEQKIISGK